MIKVELFFNTPILQVWNLRPDCWDSRQDYYSVM